MYFFRSLNGEQFSIFYSRSKMEYVKTAEKQLAWSTLRSGTLRERRTSIFGIQFYISGKAVHHHKNFCEKGKSTIGEIMNNLQNLAKSSHTRWSKKSFLGKILVSPFAGCYMHWNRSETPSVIANANKS